MKEKLVDVYLSIDETDNEVIARLRFINSDIENIYLDQNVFCFRTKGKKQIKMGCCGGWIIPHLETEYFITLKPFVTYEVKLKLNEIYQFEKGKKHLIQYSTYNPSYLDEQKLTKLESNILEVVYK